jgi:uncharacterized membrane protein
MYQMVQSPSVKIETSATVAAAPVRVFAALVDVEDWPNWTESVTSVQRVDSGAFGIGSSALIHQPRLRPATWTVTSIDPAKGFVWESELPGMRVVGEHLFEPVPGGVRLMLRIRQYGPMRFVLGPMTRKLTESYLALEVAGFKRCCEQ